MGIAIYCRISSDPQEREVGVKRQEADCRAKIQQLGLEGSVEVYTDNSVSASQPMENRPAFMQLLKDAQDGMIESIVAWRDDRLWRNPDHQRQVFAIARDAGVRNIVTSDSVYEPASVGDNFIGGLRALFAEYETASTKLRVERALEENARQGKPHGGIRPFGFKADRMTIDEDEAVLVKEAYERVLAGESINGICQDWIERGIETVSGGTWRPRTLRGILSNPRYIARRVHQGQDFGPAAWPAIVDEATFKRVQRLLSGRKRGPNSEKHLLSELVSCSDCDDTLATAYVRNRRLYRTHKQGTNHSCGRSISVDAQLLEDLVLDAVIRAIDGVIKPNSNEDSEDELLAELEAVRERMAELNQMWLDGEIDKRERADLRSTLTSRHEVIEAQMAAQMGPGLPEDVPLDSAALRAKWDASDSGWRRSVVKALIRSVEVKPSPIEGRACLHCQADISHRPVNARYCSTPCSKRAYEERQKRPQDRSRFAEIEPRISINWTE